MENWREVILDCGDEQLASALIGAIEELFARDLHSLTVDASERHIATELAYYLKARVPNAPDGAPWNVHVEYNRHGAQVKTVNGPQVVVPDIILHRIGTPNNWLAIELKKGSDPEPDADDMDKLAAYKRPQELNYTHALFIRLGIGKDAGKVACVAWV